MTPLLAPGRFGSCAISSGLRAVSEVHGAQVAEDLGMAEYHLLDAHEPLQAERFLRTCA